MKLTLVCAFAATVLVGERDVGTNRDQWVELPVSSTLYRGGTQFDIMVILRSKQGIPVITTAPWFYDRSGSVTPPVGVATHNANGTFLHFNTIDGDGTDQSILLGSIEVFAAAYAQRDIPTYGLADDSAFPELFEVLNRSRARWVSRERLGWPSGWLSSHSSAPLKPVSCAMVSASSRIEISRPAPRLTGSESS